MIKEDRDCQIIDRTKIKRMLKILEDVDIKNPELNRTNEEYFWSGDSSILVMKEWFGSLVVDTKNYIADKSKREISQLSAPEYTRSCLKYLVEEKERCEEYIMKEFHNRINEINFKSLIEENAKELCKVNFYFTNMHRWIQELNICSKIKKKQN